MMNWLFKEEPTHYGFDAFVKDKRAVWSGIRKRLCSLVFAGVAFGLSLGGHDARPACGSDQVPRFRFDQWPWLSLG